MSDDWTTFNHDGKPFAYRTVPDDEADAPWDREEGHGEVSEWTSRAKRPGERPLESIRGGQLWRYYDWQGAIAKAKADGWGAEPLGEGTKGQRAERAVKADFERMAAWCRDEWWYVGVIVAPVCECCGTPEEAPSVSLWGIESDCEDYIAEVAHELAGDILYAAQAPAA